MSGEQNDEHRTRNDRARTTGAALEAHYRFLPWLIPTVERFPRSHKFPLGDRIQSVALEVLERLVEATYTRRRRGHLAAANLGLEKLRFLFRLARDLHRRIACGLDLSDLVVDGSNPQEPVHLWFRGDDLLTPIKHRHGGAGCALSVQGRS